ncbi:MAG TPA: urease accessory protein UreD [Microvirga sp.]|jgi:urease accessory protein|nr:urease accessory protein UreD [Microvirga sp.]
MLMASPRIPAAAMPAFVRAEGGVRLVFGATPRGTAPLTIAESGGYRVRFPRTGEGVLINTGGGMTGGDRMRIDVSVGPGASAILTTQAAEKIYRSDGPDTGIAAALVLEPGSRLAWLPQEQILFDGARLARTLDVAVAPDAALTLLESVVFGRLARGEAVEEGVFRDRWRVRRSGRLALAEDVLLDGRIAETLKRPAAANGARALATFLHVGPDAEARLEPARAALENACCECGVTAFDGMLLARFLAADPQGLRADLARFVEAFRGEPMPRSWQT